MNPNIRMIIAGIICLMLIIIVFPIKFTKETKENRSALQHGIIFARYSVLAFAALLSIMFGKSAFELINNIRNNGLGSWDGVKYLFSRIIANPVAWIAWIGIISLFIVAAVFTFS
jgi:hypothetical protein